MEIIRPGLLTSVQDLGRYGWQKYGIIVSGAMDSFALRIANLLVGNNEGTPGLEITLMGPSLYFHQDSLISICGADLSPTLNQEPIPQWRPLYIKRGTTLSFGSCRSGCRAYLAIAGGLSVPQVLGSSSTYLRAKIGGFAGRALQKGDLLHCHPPSEKVQKKISSYLTKNKNFLSTNWFVSRKILPQYSSKPVLRVLEGSQFHSFPLESRKNFFSNPFLVTV